jgi:hypothetical protein
VDSEGITRLLQHPAIWRGASAARTETIATGFAALDECLPGNGWPRSGLIEILIPRLGSGELQLLMPAFTALTQQENARWCTWVAPPYEPFAPALAAQGIALERLLVVRTEEPLWAFEQALGSGACATVLAWARRLAARDIRRLQLAAEKGRTLGILFRRHRAAREASSAVLRAMLEPAEKGARVTLVKSRGGRRGSIQISWSEAHAVENS